MIINNLSELSVKCISSAMAEISEKKPKFLRDVKADDGQTGQTTLMPGLWKYIVIFSENSKATNNKLEPLLACRHLGCKKVHEKGKETDTKQSKRRLKK